MNIISSKARNFLSHAIVRGFIAEDFSYLDDILKDKFCLKVTAMLTTPTTATGKIKSRHADAYRHLTGRVTLVISLAHGVLKQVQHDVSSRYNNDGFYTCIYKNLFAFA